MYNAPQFDLEITAEFDGPDTYVPIPLVPEESEVNSENYYQFLSQLETVHGSVGLV